MTKAIWDLETPNGRLMPAWVAGMVPVLLALVVTGLLLVRPVLRGLDHAQAVLSTATELRSTSRALQRDVLLLTFDEEARAKTAARVDSRVPELRTLAERLAAELDPVDPNTANRIRETHFALADGFQAVARSVAAREGVEANWRVQQEKVLANEIPAARTNDPIIERYQTYVRASLAEVRTVLWISVAVVLVTMGFGVGAGAVVLRR